MPLYLFTALLVLLCVDMSAAPAAGQTGEPGGPLEPGFAALAEAERPHLGDAPVVLMTSRDLSHLIGPGDTVKARRSVVEVAGQPFEKAVRLDVLEPADPVWEVTLRSATNAQPIREGEVIFGTFWVRAEAANESASGEFKAFLEETGTYEGWLTFAGSPGRQWSQRYFACKAPRDLEAGRLNLVWHLGQRKQAVEVAGLQVWSLGPDVSISGLPASRVSYVGREADATWRSEAQQRIDKIRKGPLRLRISSGGLPVPEAKLSIELERHAFGFGTFIEGDSPVLWNSPDGERYREVLRRYFNRVTCAIYPAEGWGWPNPDVRARYLRVLEWADEQGFDLRAHVLVWSGWQWLPAAWRDAADDPVLLRRLVEAHLQEVPRAIERFDLDELDVMNEPRANHVLEDLLGGSSIRHNWFAQADAVLPGVKLAINEYGILSDGGTNAGNHEAYEEAIRDLLEAGAPLEVIGLQSHIGEDFTPPRQIWAVLDRFAAFGLPLQVTELDVNTRDREAQADYLRDFLTAVFAHEAVEAVTLWGFWAGAQWIPDAALWDEDWSIKPAGEAFVKLITETWHTREDAAADAAGTAEVRGFYGTFRVEVEAAGKRKVFTIEHRKDGVTHDLSMD